MTKNDAISSVILLSLAMACSACLVGGNNWGVAIALALVWGVVLYEWDTTKGE